MTYQHTIIQLNNNQKYTTSTLLLKMFSGEIGFTENNINNLFINYFEDYSIYYSWTDNSVTHKILTNYQPELIKNGLSCLFSEKIISDSKKHLFFAFEISIRELIFRKVKVKQYKDIYQHLLKLAILKSGKSNAIANQLITNSIIFFGKSKPSFEDKYDFLMNFISSIIGKNSEYIYDRLIMSLSKTFIFDFVKSSVDKSLLDAGRMFGLVNNLLTNRKFNINNRILLFKLLSFKALNDKVKQNYETSDYATSLRKIIDKSDGSDFVYRKFNNFKNLASIDEGLKPLLESKLIEGIYITSFNPVKKLVNAINELKIDKKKVLLHISEKSRNDSRYVNDLQYFLSFFPDLEHLANYV